MTFRRADAYRYKKLGDAWRRPRGKHSKVRKYLGFKPGRPLIGHKKKSSDRGFHPSGYKEVLVSNNSELDNLDNKTQAVRISASLGTRKRKLLLEKANNLKLKVLNPGIKKEDEIKEDEVE